MHNNLSELAAQRFGRLTVTRLIGKNYRGKRLWECLCSCGCVTTAEAAELKRGRKQSCGCLRADRIGKVNCRHGMTNTRTHRVWDSMLSRCRNPKSISYQNYGGRGIKVCDEWLSFEHFYRDMGESVAPLQLDRIDNNGNYEPSNCRWATPSQNSSNRRNSKAASAPPS